MSASTLRAWEQDGKIKPDRDPKNGYRYYDPETLLSMMGTSAVHVESTRESTPAGHDSVRALRRSLARANELLRDQTGLGVMERFEELAKLVFLACQREKTIPTDLAVAYRRHAARLQIEGPENLLQLKVLPELASDLVRDLKEKIRSGHHKHDVMGTLFEDLVRRTLEKTDHQQYLTPLPIIEFLFRAFPLRGIRRVLDPACGSGAFL